MPTIFDDVKPRLRPVDPQPASQDGHDLLLLRDPLQVSDRVVGMPVELAPLLALCDGTRNVKEIAATFALRYGVSLPLSLVEHFVTVCDKALLLDNHRSRAAQNQLLAGYRAAPFRRPALAGLSYPSDPEALAAEFGSYARRASPDHAHEAPGLARAIAWPALVVSPHIDYKRGGAVYASVWNEAAPIVAAADLAIVFGTDHYGIRAELTLTRQNYATPFGVLPTPPDLVEAAARAVTPEKAFASELHHRSEHSIELAVTWLHYLRRDLAPLPVLPILCGSFHDFVGGKGHPDQDPAIGNLVHTLAERSNGLRLLIVAGADLAHVGPAFGQPPQGPAERNRVTAADREIMKRISSRDARGFFESIRQVGDRYNVCGLSPIYLALRLLATAGAADGMHAPGRQVAYDTCPADEAGTSFVSVCGVVLA